MEASGRRGLSQEPRIGIPCCSSLSGGLRCSRWSSEDSERDGHGSRGRKEEAGQKEQGSVDNHFAAFLSIFFGCLEGNLFLSGALGKRS